MQIHCPICSTVIEVTEAHLGQKARCMGCSSKFIVPATPADEFQILEQGQAPAPPPPPPAQAQAPVPAPVVAPQRKPALSLPSAAGSPTPGLALRAQKKKSGAGAFLVTFTIIAAAIGFAYFKFTGDKGDSANAEQPETEETTPSETVTQSTPDKPETTVTKTAGPNLDLVPFDARSAEDGAFELTEEHKTRTLEFLKSDQANKRMGAYDTFRKLGDAHKPAYTALLSQARKYHLDQLGESASKLSGGGNSQAGFGKAYDPWKTAADATLAMVQTKWKAEAPTEYKAKHAEMNAAFDELVQLHDALTATLKASGGQGIESLRGSADVLTEIGAELAWSAGEDPPAPPDLRELIAESGGGTTQGGGVDLLTSTRAAAADAMAAAEHNSTINWGTSSYKSFATLLNKRRTALGLRALRLDKLLTDISEEHSGDMLFQNYYSHTGADGSNFGQRAKAGGFTGTPTGECIFKGNASAQAAHEAWWLSDGHRPIMYAAAPDIFGLGNASEYWTLNTGKSGQ